MSKKIMTSVILIAVLLCTMTAATLAWFSIGFHTEEPQVSGSLLGGFFESGTGAKDDPYIMTRPIHVYNLAWLQYLGEFNKPNESGEIVQTYFQVGRDSQAGALSIDMEGLVIPPIGTKEYPFVGNFNGNNNTIKNFTVSNYVGGEEGIERRPSQVTTLTGVDVNDSTNVSVVGFFGVVGELAGIDLSLEGGGLDTDGTTVVNSIYDLTLDGLTVRTETDESLVGLLAGYVNGTISNVAVGKSEMFVGKSTDPFADLGEFTGYSSGADANKINDLNAYSVFSLIGAAYKDVKWEELPTGSTVDGLFGGGTQPADGAGFGGSMDMYSLIRRLTYMYTENVSKKTVGVNGTLDMSPYPVSFYVNFRASTGLTDANKKNSYVSYKSTTAMTSYLQKGTLLALNVDTDTMFQDESTYTGVTSYGSLTTNYYSNTQNSTEKILDSNTGYIVGGGDDGNTTIIRARINKLASGTYPGLYRSIGTETNSSATFDRSKFQVLTLDVNGNLYVIDDDYNSNAASAVDNKTHKTYTDLKLSKYKDVIDNFSTTLTVGNGMIYGMRFNNGQTITNIGTADSIDVTNATDVKIANETKATYQFLDGAINFHLNGGGYITTVAGTFAGQSVTHNMFSLYKIIRDENGNIDATQSFAINKVWVKYSSDGKTINEIKYNDDGSVETGYTLAYDTTTMNVLDEINTAYYFEIPVQGGDYALTSKEGDMGAYLMYLDIGSNGDVVLGEGGDGSGDGDDAEIVHAISGVNFVKKDVTATTDPLVVFRVQKKSDGDDTQAESVTFERQSSNQMDCTVSDKERFGISPFPKDGVTVSLK